MSVPDPHPVLDVDHVMCKVDDLAGAASLFEALGFTVTPESGMADLGLANRMVCLGAAGGDVTHAIELIAVTAPERVPADLARMLDGAAGTKAIVNGVTDAAAEARRHEALGMQVSGVWRVSRQWQMPDGSVADVRFTVGLPDPSTTPMTVSFVEYEQLDAYTQPGFTTHPNGARGWSRFCVVADEDHLASIVSHLQRLYAVDPVRLGPGLVDIPVRDITIRVGTAAGVADGTGWSCSAPVDGRLGRSLITIDGVEGSTVRARARAAGLETQRGTDAVIVDLPRLGLGLEFPTDGEPPVRSRTP